jgi:hypothetical protein
MTIRYELVASLRHLRNLREASPFFGALAPRAAYNLSTAPCRRLRDSLARANAEQSFSVSPHSNVARVGRHRLLAGPIGGRPRVLDNTTAHERDSPMHRRVRFASVTSVRTGVNWSHSFNAWGTGPRPELYSIVMNGTRTRREAVVILGEDLCQIASRLPF